MRVRLENMRLKNIKTWRRESEAQKYKIQKCKAPKVFFKNE